MNLNLTRKQVEMIVTRFNVIEIESGLTADEMRMLDHLNYALETEDEDGEVCW